LLRTKNGERREIPMNEAVKSAILGVKRHTEVRMFFVPSMATFIQISESRLPEALKGKYNELSLSRLKAYVCIATGHGQR